MPEYVSAENAGRLILPGDYVFLCVDNHATRRLVSERCQALADVTLLSGGNDGVEPPARLGTYGNVQAALRRQGRDVTVPITRFHPEIARAEGGSPGGPNCGQLAVTTPQILFTNLAVASAMLSTFFLLTCGRLTYQELQLDILEGRSALFCRSKARRWAGDHERRALSSKSKVTQDATTGLVLNGTRLRRKCFRTCHLRLGRNPCRLARQVNESCKRVDFCETIQDPCQLAWQVNKSCKRGGVCTDFTEPCDIANKTRSPARQAGRGRETLAASSTR